MEQGETVKPAELSEAVVPGLGVERGHPIRFDLPESVQAMREGCKTVTRRRNKYWLKKRLGSRITIVHQGEYLGTARVMGTWMQQLGDMDRFDARCEGYLDLEDFRQAWRGLYGSWDDDEVVSVVAFYDIRWREAARA